MLGKLLGKKNKFYLELKEDSSSVVDKVGAVANQVKQETQQIVEDTKQTIAESSVVQEIKSETKQVVENVKEKVVEAKPKTKKTSIKSSKSNKTTKKQEAAPVPSAKVTDTSYSDEPFWVKLMYKTNEEKATAETAQKTFATDYLISKPQPRRRPGGSLAPFKAMARQTKV